MKSRSCLLILTVLALSLTSCGQQKSSQEIAETVKKSIVLISYQNEGGSGTGFIVQGSTGVCTMITARHVVEGRSLNLQTNDKKSWKTDSIQTSPNFDLAVVTFKSVGEKCPYPSLNLGDSDSVKEGDKIYISGFPNDRADSGKLGRQFVGGFVSGFEVLEKGYGLSYDARVENGMSGGPVLDVNGKVVAVHGLFYKGFPWGIPIKIYLANESNLVNQPIAKADSTKQEKKSELVVQPTPKADSTKQEKKSDLVNQPIVKADYTKLDQLLEAGQWKEADQETTNKMLYLAGRQQEDSLRLEDIEKFSCPDLRMMDQLWVKYSNGRFGFSVQKRIFQRFGGTKELAGNQKVWIAFSEALGWKKKEEGGWLGSSRFTFNTNAPEAHLPAATNPSKGGVVGDRMGAFFSHIETCKL